MSNTSYILVCDQTKMFTNLHRFSKKSDSFEGEHSLLLNEYSNDSYFLSKFLLFHIGQPIYLSNNQDSNYQHVVNSYSRFMWDDIDKYVEESIQKQVELSKDREMDKNLGQLQLAILQKMIEKKYEEIKNQNASKDSDHMVLLGQEYAFRWTLMTLQDIIEKGRF